MSEPNVIGIDLGGTNVRVARISRNGEILAREKTPNPQDENTILDYLIHLVKEISDTDTQAVGLGVAGLVDRTEGRVVFSPNLRFIENIPLRDGLAEAASLPVVMENDTNAAARGEGWKGAGSRLETFVFLTLGTGVGGGVVHNGRLLRIPAELGHISIDADGPKCRCGRNGCIEAFASATAIVDRAVALLEEGRQSQLRECCNGNIYRITAEDVFSTAMEGDNLSREILKDAGKYLGIGLANIVNTFGPQAVVIGGGVLGAWDFIAPAVRTELMKRAFPPLVSNLQIVPSVLGDNAGVVGAAALAFEDLDRG